jgi:hypothetical protein
MKTIAFYGHSDTTLYWTIDRDDRGYTLTDGGEGHNKTARIELSSKSNRISQQGALLVVAKYGLGGIDAWTIGVSQGKEGKYVPQWPINFEIDSSRYAGSISLILNCPDDVEIKATTI